MSGPLGGLLKFFAKEIGNKGGRIVARDIQAAESSFRWTHADKIAELKNDVGLSPSYVKELINESTKVEDLDKIYRYLNKPGNHYDNSMLHSLYQKLMNKVIEVDNQNTMREMIRVFKEKGMSMIDHLDYFI
ncbi:hypothetical protein ACFPES_03160 [Paenibacillus sp. GCM10023248]|uniref:hypothetical protein n=1 Tax=unclassified Paenibacillus TaxID=185978 RepID=UPI00237A0826|nr:hypothetical protein [Paenibacillus sp. MAHUQ-63]MDD9266024.1 hypothetical protein [Paenibacillus sp. MAHUQ-63]